MLGIITKLAGQRGYRNASGGSTYFRLENLNAEYYMESCSFSRSDISYNHKK